MVTGDKHLEARAGELPTVADGAGTRALAMALAAGCAAVAWWVSSLGHP
jgi:hypothetical protein